VTWSVWEVAQLGTAPPGAGTPGGRIVVDTVGDGEPVRMIEAVGRLLYTKRSAAIDVPVQPTVGKLGFPDTGGTLRWLRGDGVRLTVSTRRRAGATYPGGGCPAEVRRQYPIAEPLADFGGLHPDAHLAELELLSPLEVIAPGGTASMDIHWSCHGPLEADDGRRHVGARVAAGTWDVLPVHPHGDPRAAGQRSEEAQDGQRRRRPEHRPTRDSGAGHP